ncbi:NAD(P)H-binding protein [Streptomyces sp. NPDC002926]
MRLVIAGTMSPGTTAVHFAELAGAGGHDVRRLSTYDEVGPVRRALAGTDAAVLVPKRGDARLHAQQAMRTLLAAAAELPTPPRILLVSSFVVGHGNAHPLSRVDATQLPARIASEEDLRACGLPYTIVRPTWLTDDPPGAHAITLTQDPQADGMVSRADIAVALVAAIESGRAVRTTFGLFSEPGAPPADWAAAYARLQPDARSGPRPAPRPDARPDAQSDPQPDAAPDKEPV